MMSNVASTSSRARSPHVLGRTPFKWPDREGESCFELTTELKGRASLRHFLTGLHKIENHYQEAELVRVNQTDISAWSHAEVVHHLHNQLSLLSDTELKLTLRAKDSAGRKHIIEVIINVIHEDGFSIGDKARAAYDIIVRTTDKIVTTPDVTEVRFESSRYVRVRHGAQTDLFLKEASDHRLCMDRPPFYSQDYVFKWYSFIGHNQERGGGGGEGEFPRLCVLQQPRSGRFVVVCPTSGCLRTDEDEGFRTDIQSITTPDCHFFIVHNSGDAGADTFCLRPLVMRNYYLRYDALKGLRLKKCATPPYRDIANVGNFSFDFLHVDRPAE